MKQTRNKSYVCFWCCLSENWITIGATLDHLVYNRWFARLLVDIRAKVKQTQKTMTVKVYSPLLFKQQRHVWMYGPMHSRYSHIHRHRHYKHASIVCKSKNHHTIATFFLIILFGCDLSAFRIAISRCMCVTVVDSYVWVLSSVLFLSVCVSVLSCTDSLPHTRQFPLRLPSGSVT